MKGKMSSSESHSATTKKKKGDSDIHLGLRMDCIWRAGISLGEQAVRLEGKRSHFERKADGLLGSK